MGSWRNLKAFAGAAMPVTKPSSEGSPDVPTCNVQPLFAPPPSGQALAYPTAQRSMPHPAGFLP